MEAKLRVKNDNDADIIGIIYKAISVDRIEERRSRAKIYLSNDELVLEVEADDLSALRAMLNMYLRQIKVCVDVCEVLR